VINLTSQIAAGEAKNPRRNLPKAIRRVYIRILLFYIGGVTIIGLLVPSSDPGLKLGGGTAAASPFVIAIKRSGIKTLPGVLFCPMRLLDFQLIAPVYAAHQWMSSDLRMVRSIK
jgi:amino acid transporter